MVKLLTQLRITQQLLHLFMDKKIWDRIKTWMRLLQAQKKYYLKTQSSSSDLVAQFTGLCNFIQKAFSINFLDRDTFFNDRSGSVFRLSVFQVSAFCNFAHELTMFVLCDMYICVSELTRTKEPVGKQERSGTTNTNPYQSVVWTYRQSQHASNLVVRIAVLS